MVWGGELGGGGGSSIGLKVPSFYKYEEKLLPLIFIVKFDQLITKYFIPTVIILFSFALR